MKGAALVFALFALPACTTGGSRDDSGERALTELTAGRTAGAEQRCISPLTNSGARPVGNVIVYDDGPRLWVSQPVGNCPGLTGDPILIVEQYGSQVCANDRFRTLPRGGGSIPGPYCRLGPFVPYTQPR